MTEKTTRGEIEKVLDDCQSSIGGHTYIVHAGTDGLLFAHCRQTAKQTAETIAAFFANVFLVTRTAIERTLISENTTENTQNGSNKLVVEYNEYLVVINKVDKKSLLICITHETAVGEGMILLEVKRASEKLKELL